MSTVEYYLKLIIIAALSLVVNHTAFASDSFTLQEEYQKCRPFLSFQERDQTLSESRDKTKMPITIINLHDDILAIIFHKLPMKDLFSDYRVNKKWRQIALQVMKANFLEWQVPENLYKTSDQMLKLYHKLSLHQDKKFVAVVVDKSKLPGRGLGVPAFHLKVLKSQSPDIKPGNTLYLAPPRFRFHAFSTKSTENCVNQDYISRLENLEKEEDPNKTRQLQINNIVYFNSFNADRFTRNFREVNSDLIARLRLMIDPIQADLIYK